MSAVPKNRPPAQAVERKLELGHGGVCGPAEGTRNSDHDCDTSECTNIFPGLEFVSCASDFCLCQLKSTTSHRHNLYLLKRIVTSPHPGLNSPFLNGVPRRGFEKSTCRRLQTLVVILRNYRLGTLTSRSFSFRSRSFMLRTRNTFDSS